MQTFKEKLKEDLKVAFKSSNNSKKELIKMILSEVALEEGRGAAGFQLNDEGVMSILKKFKKNLEINKSGYEAQNKEIPQSLFIEMEILDEYLPKVMAKEEIEVIIDALVVETGAASMKDMGKLMGAFNAKYAGKADNKIVSQVVKEKLNG